MWFKAFCLRQVISVWAGTGRQSLSSNTLNISIGFGGKFYKSNLQNISRISYYFVICRTLL